MQKVKEFWTSLDQSIVVNKRELLLGVTACALAGVVIGVFLSPRKTLTIGSNNGNNNTGNSASAPMIPEENTCEPEDNGD